MRKKKKKKKKKEAQKEEERGKRMNPFDTKMFLCGK